MKKIINIYLCIHIFQETMMIRLIIEGYNKEMR